MRDRDVSRLLASIVRRYDVLLLLEVTDATGEAVQTLLREVNRGKDKDRYNAEVSPRLGRGQGKEQLAFIYRRDRFTVKASMVYEDSTDKFERPPFAVKLATKALEDADVVVLVKDSLS